MSKHRGTLPVFASVERAGQALIDPIYWARGWTIDRSVADFHKDLVVGHITFEEKFRNLTCVWGTAIRPRYPNVADFAFETLDGSGNRGTQGWADTISAHFLVYAFVPGLKRLQCYFIFDVSKFQPWWMSLNKGRYIEKPVPRTGSRNLIVPIRDVPADIYSFFPVS